MTRKSWIASVGRIAAVLLSLGPAMALAQSPESFSPPAKPQFFAGIVAELDESHIKVARKLVGRALESHSFVIDSKTRMNKGAIKLKSRVTVRYRRRPEGDLALEVQLRPGARSGKTP